ncbi:MAG TPA: DUF1549 domain-containing protein, partial [Pirellulaceae bacterium]|nr:DUF1549 domain-containing protein [Pirellulaceae bacterium]
MITLLLALGIVQADAAEVTANRPRMSVEPAEFTLDGANESWQLLVTTQLASGQTQDITHLATYTARDPQLASVTNSGRVRSIANGQTNITIQWQGESITTVAKIVRADHERPLNFENDIEPLLSRFSCNASGCHGKAEGQNGFKLSVFGFDPGADYRAITMEARGRRVFPAAPENSLLLMKASGLRPHGGGVRIPPDRPEYATLLRWIASGMPVGNATDPQVVKIELSPTERRLAIGGTQQLRVVAAYSDGARRDVTMLARFQSNNEGLASVDEHGQVTVGTSPGVVAVMASFQGQVAVFQAIIPRTEPLASTTPIVEHNFIDQHVYRRLHQLNIAPAELCTDAEYLRRVYLDLIGTLPTANETRAFLADARPNRRAALADELFKRTEFADYWALKFADLLRVDRA